MEIILLEAIEDLSPFFAALFLGIGISALVFEETATQIPFWFLAALAIVADWVVNSWRNRKDANHR